MVSKALAELPVEILQAEDGQDGLKKISEYDPDLILLDVTMPVMDGPEMLNQLRDSGDQTPVIALTAESKTTVIGQMMARGISDYIIKPFKKPELMQKVNRVLFPNTVTDAAAGMERASADATPSTQTGFLPTENKPFVGVLLVDDMDNVAKRLRTLLPETVTMQNCLDAKSAVQLCREKVFRAIILDSDIPDVDTGSLLRQLRTLQPAAAFAALVMRTQKDAVPEMRQLGFNGVLVKPFDPVQIQDLCAAYFEAEDVVTAKDNLLTIGAFKGREEHQARFLGKVAKLLNDKIEELAAACHESAIIDLSVGFSHAPGIIDQLSRSIAKVVEQAHEMGLVIKLVAGKEFSDVVGQFEEMARVPVYPTVAEAKADVG